jgi:hypothetical protein
VNAFRRFGSRSERGRTMHLYENGQNNILNYFSQVIAHTNTMAHTLLHGIEYRLDSTQLQLNLVGSEFDLAASPDGFSRAKLPCTATAVNPQGKLLASAGNGFFLYLFRTTTVLPYTGSLSTLYATNHGWKLCKGYKMDHVLFSVGKYDPCDSTCTFSCHTN